ncbi:Transposase IS116/IS110/IS902 family protein [Geodermatophilus saharensis]|uniref:Transposase IS116/IS110/IS902 family protein n=1 Tax=Geodermatophilus saharensis TaxID=1137994 RepID=A0A239BDQ1_9ACTN|nr:Transposase IS116/IS110/IS902 family protein [Geodermatophilus saharensis]
MLFIGDDWAQAHHDIELVDESGSRLARRRLPEGVEGLAALHALVADHLDEDAEADQVVLGIETDRGPWVQALIAAGYTVHAVNPLQAARYRERHATSGAKSDPGDAHVLAELVRLDRAHHRTVAGDSAIAEHVKVLTRTHQSMIWSRQRQTNALRSMLREFYPGALAAFADDLDGRDALAILAIAPSPEAGRRLSLSTITAALRRAGRQRNLQATAERIQAALRAPQLEAHPGVVSAYTAAVRSLVAVIGEFVVQIEVLRAEVEAGFGRHPDAEIYLSQPELGLVLGARVLAEFGDDPTRYADVRGRKNYSGMAPITRASGTKRIVLARFARNRRLADALYLQAFTALTASPGARTYDDRHRAAGATHHQALREPDPVSRTPDLRRGSPRRGVLDACSQAAGVPPQSGGAGPSAGEVDRRDRPRSGDCGVVPAAVARAGRHRHWPRRGTEHR